MFKCLSMVVPTLLCLQLTLIMLLKINVVQPLAKGDDSLDHTWNIDFKSDLNTPMSNGIFVNKMCHKRA